jgi:hypothetical protein
MASSFLIMYPDVPSSALTVVSNRVFLPDYPIYSAFYGLGYNHARLSTPQTSLEVVFDLGSGNSRTIDHLIIGGVKSLVSNSASAVYVQGSNDNSTWTSLLGTTTGFLTRSKNGPYDDDIIFTQSYNDQINAGSISAYRYFKFIISGLPIGAQMAFRKLYFGSALDMGQEPSDYNIEVSIEDEGDTWKYPRGQVIMSKAFYPKHRITVEWDGLSDAKANEFLNKILKDPYRDTFYLYTSNYKDPLYDNTLLHCRVVANQCSIKKANDVLNWNDITAVFEEV